MKLFRIPMFYVEILGLSLINHEVYFIYLQRETDVANVAVGHYTKLHKSHIIDVG